MSDMKLKHQKTHDTFSPALSSSGLVSTSGRSAVDVQEAIFCRAASLKLSQIHFSLLYV